MLPVTVHGPAAVVGAGELVVGDGVEVAAAVDPGVEVADAVGAGEAVGLGDCVGCRSDGLGTVLGLALVQAVIRSASARTARLMQPRQSGAAESSDGYRPSAARPNCPESGLFHRGTGDRPARA